MIITIIGAGYVGLVSGECLADKNITVCGNGEQIRSFCYVDDLVEGIIHVCCLAKTLFKSPVNIGTGFGFSINWLAKKL
jgi:nucleoside-diphosphate-sugar epimerase